LRELCEASEARVGDDCVGVEECDNIRVCCTDACVRSWSKADVGLECEELALRRQSPYGLERSIFRRVVHEDDAEYVCEMAINARDELRHLAFGIVRDDDGSERQSALRAAIR
jgi:hypothetical protein